MEMYCESEEMKLEKEDDSLPASKLSKSLLSSINEFIKASLPSLGLQLVRQFRRWSEPEEPKIAIRKSRPVAAARATIHIVSIIASTTILAYNFRAVFVHYHPAYGTLQYVAKLHEMLMQASLASILSGYIRQTLVGETALPFGALLAASHIQSIAYIFSLEFWGSATASFLRIRQRIVLFAILLISVGLAASVGPSSAVLLIPRETQPLVGSLDIELNETFFFPSQLTDSTIGLTNLRAAEQTFSQNCDQVPWVTTQLSNYDANITYFQSTWQGVRERTACSISLAALFIDGSIDSNIAREQWSKKLTNARGWMYSYPSKQACAKVHCTVQEVDGNHNLSFLQLYAAQPSSTPLDSQQASGFPANLSLTEGAFLDSYHQTSDAHLLWMQPPSSLRDNYSIIAIYAPSRTGANETKAWTCSVQAAWLPSSVMAAPDFASGTESIGGAVPSAQQNMEYSDSFNDLYSETWSEPIVPMSSEWANISTSTAGVNATINGLNLTSAIAILAGTSAVTLQNLFQQLDAISASQTCDPGYFDGDCAGMYLTDMLSTIVATAVATQSYQLLVTSGDFKQADKTSLTKITLSFFGIGIGYGIQTVTEIVATCILCLYCTFALGYVAWSLTSGLSSNSWVTPGEMMSLAFHSKTPAQLEHTSAGIETIGVFREPVRILVNNKGVLEFVFRSDKDDDGEYTRLQSNEEY